MTDSYHERRKTRKMADPEYRADYEKAYANLFEHGGEPDATIFAEMQADIAAAARDLRCVATPGADWVCTHCLQPMPSPRPGGWLMPDALRRQASRIGKHEGPALMLAMNELIERGVFEMDKALRVRLVEREYGSH